MKPEPSSPSEAGEYPDGFTGFSALEYAAFIKSGKDPTKRKDLEEREKEKKKDQ